jgi:ubiquinone/menaquinone biosynthesis C-methylase UbiE
VTDDPRRWSSPKADAVERDVVGRLLDGDDIAVALDVGVGTGRLLPTLEARARRVLAIDASEDHLKLTVATRRSGGSSFALADGRSLPVRTASVSAVVLIRALHLARDPRPMLAEIRRVLLPMGSFIVSYYPDPSWKTRERGFWKALAAPRVGVSPGSARDRASEARRRTEPQFRALFEDCGFRVERVVGTGFEELSVLDRLPTSFFLGLARTLPGAAGAPTRIARLRPT